MPKPSTLAARISGKQFGLLTVTDVRQVRYGSKNRSSYKAMCVCTCGRTCEVFAYSLIRGHTISCGCDKSRYVKMTGQRNYRFKGYAEIRAAFWNGYRESAKTRGLSFSITMREAWDIYIQQGGRCALSGVSLCFGVGRLGNTTASMDRIDNNLGYVASNVQWVHKVINIMRNKLTVPEFKEWCARVAQHGSSCVSDQA